MDTKLFINPNGKLLKPTKEDYKVFIPNKLPLKIEYTDNLIKKIELANNNLGLLSGLINNLPNPDLFLKPYLQKEAVISSRIEGTKSSLSDVLKSDFESSKVNDDLKEVLNYIKAMEFGLSEIKEKKISLELMLNLNRILLDGVRGFSTENGKIRSVQNWIGNQYSDLYTSIYNPPNPEVTRELLNNLVEYINTDDKSFLVKSAIIHYQFEAIHPFVDGNGRVGRLLIILYLCKSNLLDKPILYLSEYFEKDKNKYYFNLLNVSMKSDINGWVEYFLDGVIEQSKKTNIKVKKLLDYRAKTRTILKEKEVNMKVMRIFDYLFSNPYIDVIKGKEILETSNYMTSKRVILKLVEIGILRVLKEKKERKLNIYIADEINKIISE